MATGVQVVFGRRDGQLQQAIEAPVAGVDGFNIVNNLRLGDIRTVQSAGNFNADGVDDLLIGAYAFNGDDYAAPNAWVVYGNSSTIEPSIDVAVLDADQGLTLVSPLSAEQLAAVYDEISTGEFDLTTLDGAEGLRISAAQSSTPAPDRISAVGDVDDEGHADLSLVGDDGTAFVFYAAQGITGPVVNRENLPEGIATQLTDSSGDNTIAFLGAVGDLDGWQVIRDNGMSTAHEVLSNKSRKVVAAASAAEQISQSNFAPAYRHWYGVRPGESRQ